MTAIVSVSGREVWDSRGRPTVEAEVALASGAIGRSIAPSGASTGKREALELRDGGARLGGYGVRAAVEAIGKEIAPAISGLQALDQKAVDGALIALDGTEQKSRLGGNALVAVSQAVAWAAAAERRLPLWAHLRTLCGITVEAAPLPSPMIQIFGGGRHAGGRIDIQDFLVVNLAPASFFSAVEAAAEIYRAAAEAMRGRGRLAGVADEGGLWPDFSANEEALETLTRAIETAGFAPGRDVGIAIDVAASTFSTGSGYRLALEDRTLDTGALIDQLERWCDDYPIVSIEDPLGEDDLAGFAEITRELGHRVQIVGDDLLVTDAARIAEAGASGACNAALLKANQCGTLTELIAASAAARRLGWNTVQSGRSGESEDVTLSHLAVGLASDQIKVGSVTRSERTAKWNEVVRIAESLPEAGMWRFSVPEAPAVAPS